ncbi:acyltransferase family protein [Ferruginibacter sp.]
MKKIANIFKIDFDSNRIYGLDILRAVAVLVIVILHGNDILPFNTKRRIDYFLPDGVSMFFVLSGFLIGGILIKTLENKGTGINNLFQFWQRRCLRTLPLYYFSLILLIILSWLFVAGFNVWDVKHFFVFCQNFYKSNSTFFTVSWSLSVEEWFYLLIPLIIFILINLFSAKVKTAILSTVVIIIIATIIYRYYRFITIEIKTVETFDIMFRRPVLTRLDSLMFGVGGAYLNYYNNAFWVRNKNIFLVAGLVLLITTRVLTNTILNNSVIYFCNFSFVLDALSTLLLLPYLSQFKKGEGIFFKPITYVSLISYSVYLIHSTFVLQWIVKFVTIPDLNSIALILVKYGTYWMITILLSILSYKFIETPFLRFRKKGKEPNI